MKKYMIAAMILIASISSAIAQYDNRDYAYNDDRYYYDNEFDWHWDIRVRISNGIQRGLITRRESDLLYRRLEDLERKEYAYQSDGFFTGWEQQEIWDDVVYLNRRVGLELSDYDRNFYGFDVYGYDRRGYSRWYYQGGYDFFRFDKRGFGSIRLGYVPRPNYYGWYRHQNNRVAQRYCNERRNYASRGNSPRRDRDYRGGYSNRGDNDRNRGDNDRNRGRYDNDRNAQNGNNRDGERNRNNLTATEPSRSWDRFGTEPNRSEKPNVEPSLMERPNLRANRSEGNITPPASTMERPNVQNRADDDGKSGNDWNMNRGGFRREPSSGRRDN
jgi:hypothetical protein